MGLLASRHALFTLVRKDGLNGLIFDTGFSLAFFGRDLNVSAEGLRNASDCPFSAGVQAAFEDARVAVLPYGTVHEVSRATENEDETSDEDDRLILTEAGVQGYSTFGDGAYPVRTWLITWDLLGMAFPKSAPESVPA